MNITDPDFAAVLEVAEPATVDRVAELAFNEMLRRLDDSDRRSKIPDHSLFKLVQDVARILERRQGPEEDEPNLLDILDVLPPFKQQEILERELPGLRDRLASYEARLEELCSAAATPADTGTTAKTGNARPAKPRSAR